MPFKKITTVFFKLVLTLVIAFNLIIPLTVLAADATTGDTAAPAASVIFEPNVPVGVFTGCTIGGSEQTNCLGLYIKAWYGFTMGIIGIIATLMIMYAGFKYLTSRGDTKEIGDAKDLMISGISAILITFLSYTILNLVNPRLLTISMPSLPSITYELGSPGWTASSNGSTASNCDPNASTDVGGYNFEGYATSCTHISSVRSIYDQMAGKINNTQDAQKFIDQFAKGSPITGEMVMASAAKYGVDPAVIMAEMIQDSSLGTAGAGAKSKNPGNVGNTDNGAHCAAPASQCGSYCCYNTWDEGVDATALWLSKHRS